MATDRGITYRENAKHRMCRFYIHIYILSLSLSLSLSFPLYRATNPRKDNFERLGKLEP